MNVLKNALKYISYLLTYTFTILLFSACGSNTNSKNRTDTLNKNWIGKWGRDEWQNDADLSINKIEKDSIVFNLSAVSGGHDGEVDGAAKLDGHKAIFFSNEDADTCILEFEIFGDSLIMIDQVKGDCFAPMGVEYSGKYYNVKIKQKSGDAEKKEGEETLQKIGLLDSIDDSLIKNLVKSDYQLFISSTQLTSEDDDLDNFGAKVYASGVRGLFTEMENIIMIDSNKNIWAAVIDDEKIYYYSNKTDYLDKLPKTIENWRKNFTQYPIIYKSAQ